MLLKRVHLVLTLGKKQLLAWLRGMIEDKGIFGFLHRIIVLSHHDLYRLGRGLLWPRLLQQDLLGRWAVLTLHQSQLLHRTLHIGTTVDSLHQ